MTARQTIRDSAELRDVYHQPAQGALDKVIHEIDDGAAAFVAASPLFVLSTATPKGADASPRGGPPGFRRFRRDDDRRRARGLDRGRRPNRRT